MAKVQNVSGQTLTVPVLGRVVEPDEVVEIDDDLFAAFVPDEQHRSADHPWSGVESPAKAKSAVKKKDN